MPQSTDEPQVTALNEIASSRTTRPVRAFLIRVTTGPDAGKSFTLDSNQEGRILVGQSPACTVLLADATVSRRRRDKAGPRGLQERPDRTDRSENRG